MKRSIRGLVVRGERIATRVRLLRGWLLHAAGEARATLVRLLEAGSRRSGQCGRHVAKQQPRLLGSVTAVMVAYASHIRRLGGQVTGRGREAAPRSVLPRLGLLATRRAGVQRRRTKWERRWRLPAVRTVVRGRWAHGLLILGVLVSVLVGGLAPPALALAGVLRDYSELRTLGESAVHHLLAAKADIERIAGPATSLFQAQTASQPSAPYTVLVQRQAGTFYPLQVTIHPSTHMVTQGLSTTSVTRMIGADTMLQLAKTSLEASPTPTPPIAGSAGSSGPAGSGDASATLDPTLLQAARRELSVAQHDLQELGARLRNPDWVLATAGSVPQANKMLATVGALVDIGDAIATTGIELCDVATPFLLHLHGSSSLGSQAVLTPADLQTLQLALARATQELGRIAPRLATLDVSQLPLSTAQKASVAMVQGQLPRVQAMLQQLSSWLPAIGWLLGVGQARHFLVQTLDRAELRPSGGFTGDYGVLTLQDGKLAPLTLANVNDIDYGYQSNGWIFGQRPPAPYAWWPFGNWGLRDSNLSADFPTTATINMQVFHDEGGGDVDGVIQFTPIAIEHVLSVTGPIVVPGYNETITAANLEDKLHYYQLDPAGLAKQQQLNPGDTTHSLRKRFTQLLAQLLQDKVRQLPLPQLLAVGHLLLADLRARDVQIYVTNPQAEQLLAQLHATGAVDTTPGLDGYMLVQANVSAAKSSTYVQITQRDEITLDDHGGATHQLVIQLYNNNLGKNVYGFQAYRDYVRIYVPDGAHLSSGSGFDTGQPLCWAPLQWMPRPKPAQFAAVPDCPATPYPSGEMVCMPGFYGPGPEAPSFLLGTDGRTPWVLDRLGAPTSTRSDLPGRAMWGGYVNISPGCTATVRLNWYVPGVVRSS